MTSETESPTEWTREEIVEVAIRQKQIIWVLLVNLLVMLIPYATIVTGIIQIYFILKLAQAARSSAAWLYIILAFIPLIGLVALFHISGKATKILQANGVTVGLMGAKSSDLEKIRTSA